MSVTRPRLVTAGLAAALAVGQFAFASGAFAQCARPADKSAFDVAGLKSELMVVALSCDAREKYNAFVVRYQPDLRNQERALNTYFSRTFGRRAQKEHDDYITSLANAQSEVGIKEGTLFCLHNVGIFEEVMKLPQGADLASFAGTKSLTQPVNLVVCGAPAGVPATRTASATAVAAPASATTRRR